MSEAGQPGTGERRKSPHVDQFCDSLRDGLNSIIDAVTPPESARNHFHQSRVEFLRGIRELIDHRIDRLSRTKTSGGTRIVVD